MRTAGILGLQRRCCTMLSSFFSSPSLTLALPPLVSESPLPPTDRRRESSWTPGPAHFFSTRMSSRLRMARVRPARPRVCLLSLLNQRAPRARAGRAWQVPIQLCVHLHLASTSLAVKMCMVFVRAPSCPWCRQTRRRLLDARCQDRRRFQGRYSVAQQWRSSRRAPGTG